MGLTTDPTDPRLGRGGDTEKKSQNEIYLVLSDEEKAKGFIRPVRRTYRHTLCREHTTVPYREDLGCPASIYNEVVYSVIGTAEYLVYLTHDPTSSVVPSHVNSLTGQ